MQDTFTCTLLSLVNSYTTLLDTSYLSHSVSLFTGDYGSVFSLVTNTELQPVKTLMSHALVCTVNFCFTSLHFKTINVLLSTALHVA